MINGFKEYFISHNEVVYDNPSPGNKQGGITTLEDKSCGCVQKGGSAPIMDVIGYGDPVVTKGLNMLYGPGNDLVSATALTAAGAHMILFSTGRGTPFGAPAPTLKIATNSQLAERRRTGSTSTPVWWRTASAPWTRPGPICTGWCWKWPPAKRPAPRKRASAKFPSSKTAWSCDILLIKGGGWMAAPILK